MAEFEGEVAIVTGGSSGIGLATASRLVREGAKVVICGRDADGVATACRELGPRAEGVTCDVSKLEQLDRLHDHVAKRHGAAHVLFVNAGIAEWKLLEEVTTDHYDRLFDTNVRGAFFTIQRLVPLLAPGARIVLNTSVANTVGARRTCVYSATKAALRSFARTLSTELLPRGIRVNAVSPGPTMTPIHGKYGLPAEVLEEMGKETMARLAIGRMASAEEVAEVAVFLASKRSAFVVGQEFVVDGGMSAL